MPDPSLEALQRRVAQLEESHDRLAHQLRQLLARRRRGRARAAAVARRVAAEVASPVSETQARKADELLAGWGMR